MPFIIFIIVSAAGWILAVVVFEGLFYHFKTKLAGLGDKSLFCRIWWALLFLFALGGGMIGFVLNLPILLPIALSHIDLCRKYEIITVKEVLGNIPTAVSEAVRRIRPYIK